MNISDKPEVSAAVKWAVHKAQELAAAKAAKEQARKESLVNPKRR